MYKNCYISNMAMFVANILFRLLDNQRVYLSDYPFEKDKLIRYIANIRYMLCEYHITYLEIVYDSLNKCYFLIRI